MRALACLLLVLSARAADVEHGKKIYQQRCSQCHGINGTPFVKSVEDPAEPKRDDQGRAIVDDAAAPAARFVMPRPRDFTRGLFKIRSTPSGEMPTDEDLARIVGKGMPGSSMPAWKGALTGSEIRDVVAFIKTLSSRFEPDKPSKTLDLSGAVNFSADSARKGRALYEENGCNQCHGNLGRGDGPSASGMNDDWGNPIRPANFHKPWTLRGGSAREDIFRTFMTGLDGTPMPAYLDVFGDTTEGREKGWHLANYIHSLGRSRPNFQQVLRASYRRDLPDDPGSPIWDSRPPVDFLLGGQVVAEPRQFTPSIDRIEAKAFYNEQELALLLAWDDRSQEPGDSIEVQVPRRFSPRPGSSTEPEKPYFLRGDAQNPVELWRFDAKTGRVTAWTAKGPRSMPAPIPPDDVHVSSAAFADGLWRVAIRRRLEPGEGAGVSLKPGWFVPMAFLAWDGANGDIGLKGSVSTWYYLLLEPQTPAIAYAKPVLALIAFAGSQFWWLGRRRRR